MFEQDVILANMNGSFSCSDDDFIWLPLLCRYVPLGLKAWFTGCGIQNVTELDWWQEVRHGGDDGSSNLTVALTPAQHWSSRLGWDKRRTLWGSFVVMGPEHRFYFSGAVFMLPGPHQQSATAVLAVHVLL